MECCFFVGLVEVNRARAFRWSPTGAIRLGAYLRAWRGSTHRDASWERSPGSAKRPDRIRTILSNLRPGEAFFSIDEYGPFASKAKPGRTLAPPGVQPTVPQWQRSHGCMIMTAALEFIRIISPVFFLAL